MHKKYLELTKLSLTQEDYIKKETVKLNKELDSHLKETRSREKYSLTIIAGVAGWIVTHKEDGYSLSVLVILSCIPLLTTLIYGFSVYFIFQNIIWIGNYLKKVENYFLNNSSENNDNGFGWEKYFKVENKKGKFVVATFIFWFFQIALAVSLLLWVIFSCPHISH